MLIIKNLLFVIAAISFAGLLLISPVSRQAWGQAPCRADMNCDGKVVGSDLAFYKQEYGRFDCETHEKCYGGEFPDFCYMCVTSMECEQLDCCGTCCCDVTATHNHAICMDQYTCEYFFGGYCLQ